MANREIKPYSDLALEILKALDERYSDGMCTDEIASMFKLTNRQVGGIMGSLKRKGKVFTYTRGTIMIKSCSMANTAPMGLSNSFYEIIEY